MVDSSLSSQQLLVLKVMRLARPKLSSAPSFCADPVDPTGFSQLIEEATAKRTGEPSTDIVCGQYLIAPQMFENIYLGETFTFYVNCVNESDQKVTDVYVKCELQTNSQRVSLPCSLQEETLGPGAVSGQVLSHEVKELGQHILICSVNYKTIADEKMYFRKFFKFPVTKPIDVKTKFYNAEDSSNFDVFLEAQIENASATPMMLDKIDLEPSPQYSVAPVQSSNTNPLCGSLLRPGDVRQFLFCLTPKDPFRSSPDMAVIGKLDMSWRTNMGEKGRLQTSSLQRIAPGYGDVRLVVDRLPPTVKLHEPFEMHCLVHNNSERAVNLVLSLISSPTFVYCSMSGQPLGQLPPHTTIPFKLNVLPVTAGFQTVSGVHIYDTLLKRTYEHEDMAQVFVC